MIQIKNYIILLNVIFIASLQAMNNTPTTIPDAALLFYKKHQNQVGIDMVLDHEYPLHYAAETNSIKMADHFLKHGADQNAQDRRGYTPLHAAAKNNSFSVAQLLLDRGADKEAKEAFVQDTPLHEAADHNSLAVAQLLLDRGADVDAKNYYCSTPLHYAACKNSLEVAQLLLDNGADKDPKDYISDTPLIRAAFNKSVAVVKLLITRGADIDAQAISGGSALHYSAQKNSLALAQLLLEHGARCNETLRTNSIIQDAARVIREKYAKYLNLLSLPHYLTERKFKRNDREIRKMEKVVKILAVNPWIFEE